MKTIIVSKTPKISELTASGMAEHVRKAAPEQYERMALAHTAHHQSLDILLENLDEVGFEWEVRDRDQFEASGPEDSDFVITVGGDGTLLDVSHHVANTPILGLNSDPERSTGFFTCASAAGSRDFIRLIAEAWWGCPSDGSCEWYTHVPAVFLPRIEVVLDDNCVYPLLTLNDLLVTNRHAATMSKYEIALRDQKEVHASSGVWISAPAGSTAGIRSAGGGVMPLTEDWIQYVVREPYSTGSHPFPLLKGVVSMKEGLTLTSHMDNGAIYMDGPHIEIDFGIGTKLTLRKGQSLHVLGMNR